MKKLAFVAILLLSLSLGVTAYAADALKIQQNGVVKRAKEIGSGNGIVFTLSDLNNASFVIDSYELAIFEKTQTDTNYKIFGSTKLVENPTSLNVTFDFGNITKYQTGAKYKIGYRYYVRSLDDSSILEIAGRDTKEGWRLVGEVNPTASSAAGFSFYLNSAPAISLNNVSWNGEDINGARTFTYTTAQLTGAYLHKSALSNGITVGYSVSDPDSEDTLTVYYKLINKANGAVIVDSVLGNDRKISNATAAENIDLVLYAVDNWGGRTDAAPVTLKIDRQTPVVTSQFQDMGRVIRGGELYSKFILTDDSGIALSNGNVYYSVKRNGVSVANTTRLSNHATGEYTVNMLNQTDGAYEITLTMFDKAYNKLVHTQTLTLDNTPPTLRFIPQNEDARSTLYNLWVNYNKNIVIDVADSSGIKKIDCLEGGGSIYSGGGTGIKFIAVPNKTGKLNFSISLEDNACTLDKTNNRVNTASQGNISTFSSSVWIDKTPPAVTINADENTWYAPLTVTASFNDNDSGIKTKQYQIGEAITENWLTYTDGIELGAGGIYYLHVKATDNAGNETVVSKKIKVNSPLVIGKVKPTSDYLHTIYNSLGDIYIIKNTAFNTKFTFDAQDNDITDTLKADVKLINEDNNSIYSTSRIVIPLLVSV